ncbi:MAG: hypothetical protein R3C44_04375 [Chloroflexota bacterium]
MPDWHYLGLGNALHKRVDTRVGPMMADGLLDEVATLRTAGYDRTLPAMSGLGYRQIMAYLDGERPWRKR